MNTVHHPARPIRRKNITSKAIRRPSGATALMAVAVLITAGAASASPSIPPRTRPAGFRRRRRSLTRLATNAAPPARDRTP